MDIISNNTDTRELQKIQTNRNNILATELLQNGTYFKNSLSWYNDCYLSSYVTRIYCFLYIIFYITCIAISCNIIYNSFPLVVKKSYVIKTTRDAGEFTQIKQMQISYNYLNSLQIVTRFLIENYIKNREEYISEDLAIENLNEKIQKVQNNSSPRVFQEFQQYLSRSNPDSPVANFIDGSRRTIEIKEFSYIKPKMNFIQKFKDYFVVDKFTNKATVRFASNSYFNDSIITKNWVAEITFAITSVEKSSDGTFKSVTFYVTDYNLMKLN